MNHSENFVSIILPNYNHAKYLQDRLDSIFNQTHQEFEVIILDDQSTDHSLEVLKPYRDHPKVSTFWVNGSNSGSPFKQWQKGLKLAKGHYIWIAESDDFCDLNFLETQLECLYNADVAVAKTITFIDGVKKHEVRHPVFDTLKQTEAILHCPILNVSSVLFKSQLLNNGMDERFADYNIIGDKVFYFEYFRDSVKVYNNNTKNYFRQSSSSISRLDYRDLSYYRIYFKEHCNFIRNAKRKDISISRAMAEQYIRKFYRRISNRVSKEQKHSFAYLKLFITYKLKVLLN